MTQRGIYLVLAVLIALIGTWVHSKWRQYDTFSASLNRSQTDFYMSGFTAYSTHTDGKPQYILVADHSIKQNKDATVQIFQPDYTILTESGSVVIKANMATENAASDIELTGAVTIVSKTKGAEPNYRINTEQLVYSAHNQQINTDMPIKIIGINNTINSTGLNADLFSQTTKLKSNVHTKYTPAVETPSQ